MDREDEDVAHERIRVETEELSDELRLLRLTKASINIK